MRKPDLPETADVVIVGGGSAGSVLAARLSQDPARTVLLLEAGHAYAPDAFPPEVLDAGILADPGHDWGYTARATDQAPSIPIPRGKVLGGSSAVNAAVALRARPTDFAKWGGHGADGWSFADVLPTFKLLENTPTGEDAYHGRTGPLPVRQRADEELTPSQTGFIDAAVARGYKRVHDFNGAEQDGAGGPTVNVVGGIRQNAAMAYLTAEVRRRANLTIRGDVTIDRVLFDGTTAAGVAAADGTVYRGREVILSGGSYGSAAILLRSGVGPAGDLTALGIAVVADLPVGRRLQDHPFFHTAHALAPGHLEMTPAVGAILWTASSEAAAGELDLQIVATHLLDPSYSPTGGVIVLSASVVLPESTGTLRLASRDPGVAPLIDCNFLAAGRDARRMLEGVKLAHALAGSPAFAAFTAGELIPIDAVDDGALTAFIAGSLATYYHPTSTAPMGGPGDPQAVTDPVGAVKGVSGLRVVDASIIPEIPSTPINLTVMMLAERIYQRVYQA
jgi:choline dehydrogenase